MTFKWAEQHHSPEMVQFKGYPKCLGEGCALAVAVAGLLAFRWAAAGTGTWGEAAAGGRNWTGTCSLAGDRAQAKGIEMHCTQENKP